MESNFNNREFEQYIKSTADQYRMIPSERVWKGINNTLHTRRKWYGIGLALLLLSTGVSVTWVMLSNPSSRKQEIASDQISRNVAQAPPVTDKKVSPNTAPKDINTILATNRFSPNRNEVPATTNSQSNELPAYPGFSEADAASSQIFDGKTNEPIAGSQKKLLSEPVFDVATTVSDPLNIFTAKDQVADNKPILSTSTKRGSVNYPLTIESVFNSYHGKKIDRRLTWQIYFAPTVSYRKLSLNKSYDPNVSPFSANNYPFANSRDVNGEVTHKPDMGLELGLSTKYPLTKSLNLTAGFQFNINRYDIKAFAYYGEEATINLNGGNGTNSMRAWTYYRNYDGYKSDWLKNYYFSVSAPVGAEIRLIGNDKTYFGVAGNVQPTYIVKDRAFLISTDYKNYVEIPNLIRHWNINTSLETFISYTSHSSKTRWQIGPQIRYQVLSSFKKTYPVSENLFDFGLKVGVSHIK
ncbi:MAG: hypothetical protein ACHQFX_17150 [Chitinophagales bacterium]